MLGDPRRASSSRSFAGQWLGLRGLESHQVDADGLSRLERAAARARWCRKGLALLRGVPERRPHVDEFFTADVNFVDARWRSSTACAAGGTTTRVESSTRRHSAAASSGLASFLTLTSFSYRTAPTLRGKWVLENLLCEEIAAAAAERARARRRAGGHRRRRSRRTCASASRRTATNPQCAGCHTILDPIGLGLENFDAIGALPHEVRERRRDRRVGRAARRRRPSTASPSCRRCSPNDARLLDCASEKLMTYALSRKLRAEPISRTSTQFATTGAATA